VGHNWFRATGPAPVDVLVLGAGSAGMAAAAAALGLTSVPEPLSEAVRGPTQGPTQGPTPGPVPEPVPGPEPTPGPGSQRPAWGAVAGVTDTGGARVVLVDGSPPGRGGWGPHAAVFALAAAAIRGAGWEQARHQLQEARRAAQTRHEARLDALRKAAGGRLDIRRGRARFTGAARVLVDPEGVVGEGPVEVRARRVVVATGSHPALPEATGLGETRYVTVADLDLLLEEDPAPKSVVVLGGGGSGCAAAQALARLGVAVTLVEAEPRLLPREDPEVAGAVTRVLVDDGVRVAAGTEVATLAPTLDGGAWVGAPDGGDLAAERLVLATGWRPATGALQAALGGVPLTPEGAVAVDDRMVSGSGEVLAAGSVTGDRPHPEGAAAAGRVAAANALARRPRTRRARIPVPYLTCTDPPVATVGSTVVAASGTSRTVGTVGGAGASGGDGAGRSDGVAVGQARVDVPGGGGTSGDGRGGGRGGGGGVPGTVLARVVTAGVEGRGARGPRMLGATVVGRGAAEAIAVPALMLRLGLPPEALRDLIGAGGPGSVALRRAAESVRPVAGPAAAG
jgi:pyruvate/2-oxoglutarate dehydrogenase complex dihydrolipoamide dehydrogenase (E3) component